MNKKTKAIILISTAIVIISITAIIILLTTGNGRTSTEATGTETQNAEGISTGAQSAEEALQILTEAYQKGDADKLISLLAPPAAEYVQENKYVKQKLETTLDDPTSIKATGESKNLSKSEIEEYKKELDEYCNGMRDSYEYIDITSAVAFGIEFISNDYVDAETAIFFESDGKWYLDYRYWGILVLENPVSYGG